MIKEEREKDKNIQDVKVVANLPYYITTPIIMKLIENDLDIESITVMIQKEVAERLLARPGSKDGGVITYTTYYYCETKKIREVENTCFIPAPEVTSEVINLKLRKCPPVEVKDKKIMFHIIKSAFMQRRKTLVNSLEKSGIFKSKTEILKILEEIGLRNLFSSYKGFTKIKYDKYENVYFYKESIGHGCHDVYVCDECRCTTKTHRRVPDVDGKKRDNL